MNPSARSFSAPQRRPPRWSAPVPSLATAYVEWWNRHGNRRFFKLSGLTLAAGAVGVSGLVLMSPGAVVSMSVTLERHAATLAVVAAIVSALLVSRQRSIRMARADRSWVAALPVSDAARRIERLVLPLVPVMATAILVMAVGLLTCAVLVLARLPAIHGIIALCWLLGGMTAGGAAGLLVPSPKPVVPYPGSRYVPHRVTHSRRPVPSLTALGIWPVRRMFVLLQPKMVSRALLPVLLAMPLGATAADATVWIGEFGLLAALALTGASVAWVWRAARRWLTPLPVFSLQLLGVVAWRALILMAALGAAATWLGRIGRA